MVSSGPNAPLTAAPLLTYGTTSPQQNHDEAIEILDMWSNRNVLKGIHSVTPPGSPTDGDIYFVEKSGTATGAWTGQEGKIAAYRSGWIFTTPTIGDRIWLETENCAVWYYTPDAGTNVFWIREISDAPGFASGNTAHSFTISTNVEIPIGVDRAGNVIWMKGIEMGAMPAGSATKNTAHNITNLDLDMTGNQGLSRFDVMFSNGTTIHRESVNSGSTYDLTWTLTSTNLVCVNNAATSMTAFIARAVVVFKRSTGL